MDLSSLYEGINEIESNEFGLNRVLINLILQMFLKNNIDDPNDIINTIAQYLDIECHTPLIHIIAGKLNIMWQTDRWIWVE